MNVASLRRKQFLAAVTTAVAAISLRASGQTTSFLSVDINGGDVTDPGPPNSATNLGGQSQTPVGGFVWTPWGGQTNTGGDGTQLPMTGGGASGPLGGYPTLTLSKTFTTGAVASGAVTVTLSGSISGGNQNTSFNSRDRGTPTGSTNFGDLYRDFVFLVKNGANGLGGNRIAVTVSGLDPNKTYSFTSFNDDPIGGSGQVIYTAIDPQSYGYQDSGNGTLFSPPPEPLFSSQIVAPVTFLGNSNLPPASPYAAASTFKITSDNSGNATVYEWVNNFNGQGQTPINGFQIDNPAFSTTWAGTASGNWGSGPWSNGQANAVDAVANFGTISSPQTVTLETPKTVGVLNINSPVAYTLSGATLTIDAASASYFADAKINGSGSTATSNQTVATFGGYGQINLMGSSTLNVVHTISSAVVLNDNTAITVAANLSNLIINGPISGTGALNKFGPGALVLNGNNSYSGTTLVGGSRLFVNGTHTGGGTYTIAGGGILGGTGNIHSEVDLWNNGTLTPGAAGAVGTLTMDSLVIGSQNATGGTVGFNINVGSASASKIAVSNNFNFSSVTAAFNTNPGSPWTGTVNITPIDAGGIADGTFAILSYPGTPLASLGPFALTTTTVDGFTFALANDTADDAIDLVVTGGTIGSTWNVDSNGSWSNSANWSGGVPNAVGATANFGTIITSSRTVTVDAPQTVGTINFSSPLGYVIGGTSPSAITLAVSSGQAAINVTAGSQTISAPVILSNDTTITSATGTGVALTGTLTATGHTITKAGAGSVQFENVLATGLVINAGSVKIDPKATNNATTGTSNVTNLTIAGNAPDAWTSQLDVTNNSLVVDYSGATPIGTIRNQLHQGLNGGSWGGNGITSASAAAVAATAGSHRTAIGYAEASTLGVGSFGGQTVDTTAVLLKYTMNGDANLDGKVNASDFDALAAHYGNSGSAVWTSGDFNYDGTVNVQDFNALAGNFNQVLPASAPALGTLVPEPASLGLLGLMMLGAQRRRRR